MKILAVGKPVYYNALDILNVAESDLSQVEDIETYNYIIISGGDGTIRRVMNVLSVYKDLPTFILNPTGSFNVIAKLHSVPKLQTVLDRLVQGGNIATQPHEVYKLNDECFLFSAGNMGDLQHILLSETLRFGMLEKGAAKYILAFIFLLPLHIILTPFMLFSKSRFFIFTPIPFVKKFGSFYGEVVPMDINLHSGYNHIELDGDIVTIKENLLNIRSIGFIKIVGR